VIDSTAVIDPKQPFEEFLMTGDENPHSDLKRIFGDYQSNDREEDWQTVVDALSEGQSVTGPVVARAHYGAYVDIGVGFPALLQIILMRGLDHEAYIANEWSPVGSEVTARILRIAGRHIALEQIPFEEVKQSMRARLEAESGQ